MSAGKPHHASFVHALKRDFDLRACVAKNWLHSWTVNRQSHTTCISLQMYGVVIPDFLMNCWRDTPQQKHPHQTGIQKRCLVAKEPEHWFQHTFFCTAQIMHQWKQSEYHHPVGFKTVQWEEFNTDLLCDCTYLWAGRACSAITAVWTDSTHSTQLILQESVLIQHFELKQKLYHDVILVNMTCTLQMGQSEGGRVISHPKIQNNYCPLFN